MRPWRAGRLLGLLPILALIGAWQVAVSAKLYPPVLLPSPGKVAGAFVQWGPVIAANAGGWASPSSWRCRWAC